MIDINFSKSGINVYLDDKIMRQKIFAVFIF